MKFCISLIKIKILFNFNFIKINRPWTTGQLNVHYYIVLSDCPQQQSSCLFDLNEIAVIICNIQSISQGKLNYICWWMIVHNPNILEAALSEKFISNNVITIWQQLSCMFTDYLICLDYKLRLQIIHTLCFN